MSTEANNKTIELFLTPDSGGEPSVPPEAQVPSRTKSRRGNAGKPVAVKGQAYLPGLSRRGRPRSPNPVSPTTRAAESRRKRMQTGAKRVELMLEPEVAARLDALTEHFKETRVELLSRLIIKAAKRFLD